MTESERQIDSIWVFIFALYQVTVKCEIDRSINKAKFSSSLYDWCVYGDSNAQISTYKDLEFWWRFFAWKINEY